MRNGNRRPSHGTAVHASSPFSVFDFSISAILLGALISGCAAPGEPIERRPPVPTAIADLAAAQQGSDFVLTFTLPKETVQKLPLKSPPAVEIYREFSVAGPTAKNLTLVATIPPAVLGEYTAQGQVHYPDSLRPEDFAQNPAAQVVYSVRTRATEKKESDDSNLVAVPVYVPPKPIDDAKAQVTHDAILLTWTGPATTVTGSPVSISGYRIYRSDLPAAKPGAPGEPPKSKPPFMLVGEAEPGVTSFADSHFNFGDSYEYKVRSVIPAGGVALESDDSNLVDVTPRDVFPPGAPQGLEAVVTPAEGSTPASLDLSWAINPETDLAGYNIYRSEKEGVRGDRLNSELLRTPAFRDMNAVPGHHYFYTVTAVDTAGSESTDSAPVAAGIPADSQ